MEAFSFPYQGIGNAHIGDCPVSAVFPSGSLITPQFFYSRPFARVYESFMSRFLTGETVLIL